MKNHKIPTILGQIITKFQINGNLSESKRCKWGAGDGACSPLAMLLTSDGLILLPSPAVAVAGKVFDEVFVFEVEENVGEF